MTALLVLFGLAVGGYAAAGHWDSAALFAVFLAVTAVFRHVERRVRP